MYTEFGKAAASVSATSCSTSTIDTMWPFSSSNTAIIAQKRSERSEGLRSAPEEVAENVVFLKATGEFKIARDYTNSGV